MKTSTTLSRGRSVISPSPGHHARRGLTATLAVLIGIGSALASGRAQPPAYRDAPGVEVLTRGPVHEAFAGIITFNPEPGVIVAKAPPELIEELPPEERPAGDNVAWIPGYWAWDDERSDFLWISGTWRALPPGREWMAGYWGPTNRGYQWISGYWAEASTTATTYLPAPPATVEAGPNVAAPSADYSWSPGCWIWYQGRYAWSPGYWVRGQPDWDWVPAHYVWTPRGYIFVEGFWDYPVERRGLLFAPVHFESRLYSRRSYSYSPRIVINLSGLVDHLFLRPTYQHYYFGDYYAPSYSRSGYYASYSFQSSRHGYDPFYSRQRWEHRQDREWERRVVVTYQDRRDHEAARPPRTWAAQVSVNVRPTTAQQPRMMMATPIEQLARSRETTVRFQAVARDERQTLAQRGRDVQQSREQRRTLESVVTNPGAVRPGATAEPTQVQLPRSPIAARSGSQFGRNQGPPTSPQPARPDLRVQPRREAPGRPNDADRSPSPAEPRPPTTSSRDATSRDRSVAPGQVQQEAEQRTRESAAEKYQEEAQRHAQGMAQKAQQDAERQARDASAKAKKKQPNAPGLARKAQPEPAVVKDAEGTPKVAPPPAKPEPDGDEKDPPKPVNRGQDRDGKGKP